MNINKTIAAIKREKCRSAWSKGVQTYALMLLEELKDNYSGREICNRVLLTKALLNGASSWEQYSYGGCALIYDGDIAKTLCTPSELKRCKNGERMPNSREGWLDVQARALGQAYWRIIRAAGLPRGL
jgi:hypothetical protein